MRPAPRATRHLLPAFLAALFLAACEFGRVTVPQSREQVAVHAVLNPALRTQWVLVEHTLTGRIDVPDTLVFDPADPIRSSAGMPVSGAVVEVTGEAGESWRGAEEPAGSGVYRIDVPADAPLRMGARYHLRVRTPEGTEVTGETTVPFGPSAPPLPERQPFDRDRDTLRLRWPAAALARSHLLRVDSPRGPFFLFVDSLAMRLPGSLRNLFADRLPRVFVPGFEQAVTVSAVDTNVFDYYRSRNDPFTGSGIINRLHGGVGLFGSATTLAVRLLDVEAPVRAPVEGRYLLVAGAAPATALRLWVETPAAGGEPAGVSGSWQTARGAQDGFIGVLAAPALRVALLNTTLDNDTTAVLDAELRGDSIVGRYRGEPASVVYVKQP